MSAPESISFLGRLHSLLLAAPLGLWLACYIALICWFVPRLTKVAEAQADARSDMTGRIVDSYTNIATVKLFAHAGGELPKAL